MRTPATRSRPRSAGGSPPDQLAERIHEAGYDRPDHRAVPRVPRPGVHRQLRHDDHRQPAGGRGAAHATAPRRSSSRSTRSSSPSSSASRSAWSPPTCATSWPDAVLRVFAILCYATPVFFAGLLLKLVFAVWLGWLPGRRPRARAHRAAALNRLDGAHRHLPHRRDPARQPGVVGDVLEHAVLPGARPRPADRRHLPAAGAHERDRHARRWTTWMPRARAASASSGSCASTPTSPRSSRSSPSSACRSRCCSAARCSPRPRSSGRASASSSRSTSTARDFVAVQGIVALLAVIVALTNFIVDIIAALIDPRVRY